MRRSNEENENVEFMKMRKEFLKGKGEIRLKLDPSEKGEGAIQDPGYCNNSNEK